MEEKKELAVVALSQSASQKDRYVLVLEAIESGLRIPVIIGAFEAQAIALAMEQMQPARPMPHDLMQHLLTALNARLREVFIHRFAEATFHARLILESEGGLLREVDARTSDAVALAVRCQAPVFIRGAILAETGIQAELFPGQDKKGSLSKYSIAELEELLKKLLDKEDYESAVRIRNLLERRKKDGR